MTDTYPALAPVTVTAQGDVYAVHRNDNDGAPATWSVYRNNLEVAEVNTEDSADLIVAGRVAAALAATAASHVDYPHHAGYLYDCPACEAGCHCAPDAAECVYAGRHTTPKGGNR